ncbi:hypothetical protein HPB47_019006 [Ixodes persulcatus]|uniref:Uncharacterized protein n=1 Tax=Ixodes persulcatus TaxID=34615 RepID=A0AC60QLJ9_IXOPE|nr:hypothetical protein HPB47_019006 [Ixodes persulcatus]
MQTDFSDLLTLVTAADAFAWSPLQREGEMPTLQREAPFDAPLEPSVAPTPLRTGAIAPGSFLSAPAPPPAHSEAYRSPHGETAAAHHHTLLENAARYVSHLRRGPPAFASRRSGAAVSWLRQFSGSSWTTAARDSSGGPATPAGRGPNQQPVVFVGLRDRHPARDCPLIIFGTPAAVGKLADQGPAVPVRPVNKSLRLWDLRVFNCQGVMHLTGRPVGNFDPEGLIFAVRLYSEPVKLYDLRAFDKGPFNTFKLPRDKECD